MVDVRIGRHNQEWLATVPPTGKATRFVAEVVHDQATDPNAEIVIGRHNQEVLAFVPPPARATRFVAEVVHDQAADPNAEVVIGRHSQEVLAFVPNVVKATRLVAEILHDLQADPLAEVVIGRHSQEVLAHRFIKLEPCPIPSFWRYFSHNFATEFRLETEFRTTVSRGAESLSEDRTRIFERPRRILKVRWSEKGLDDKRNLMDFIQSLRSWKTNEWMIPLSSDCGILTASAASATNLITIERADLRRFFIGGRVAVVKTLGDRGDVQDENGDLAGVHLSEITGKSGLNSFTLLDALPFDVTSGRAFMVPLVCVHPRLVDTIKQHHCRLWDMEMEFEEKEGTTAIPPIATGLPEGFDTFQNLPILRPRHDYSNPLNIEIFQEGTLDEIGRGKGLFTRGATQRVKHRFKMFEEREKAWDYIRFFETRVGRWLAFWLIDQEMLFNVIDLETTFIDVAKLGDFTQFTIDNEFFGFMLEDGTCFVRETLSFEDNPTSWRINLVGTLPAGLAFQDVVLSGRARKTRNLKDSFEERWFHANAVRFDVETISLLEEKDVTLDP